MGLAPPRLPSRAWSSPDLTPWPSPQAFRGCSALASIDLPAGLLSIGHSSFSGCASLSRVVFPDTLASVGEEAFLGCLLANRRVTLPDSAAIGACAFHHATTIVQLPPARMRAQERLFALFKTCLVHARLRRWLVRAAHQVYTLGGPGFKAAEESFVRGHDASRQLVGSTGDVGAAKAEADDPDSVHDPLQA